MAVLKCPKCGVARPVAATRCSNCRTPFTRKEAQGDKLKEMAPLVLLVASVCALITIIIYYSILFPESVPVSGVTIAGEHERVAETVLRSRDETGHGNKSEVEPEVIQAPVTAPTLSTTENRPDLPVDEALCEAVKTKKIAEVQSLLKKGATPDATDRNGVWTPLMLALESNESSMVKLLLDSGADPNRTAPNSPDLPLMYASNIPMIEMLIEKGADMHLRNSLSGLSVLTAAIYNQSPELLEYYLNRGVDINMRDRKGTTPLMLAARLCRRNLVGILVKRGADMDCKDRNGMTALSHALTNADRESRTNECSQVYRFLLDQGAGK